MKMMDDLCQNVIIVISYVHGIDVVTTEFTRTAEAIGQHVSLSQGDQQAISMYLGRLPLVPRSVKGPLYPIIYHQQIRSIYAVSRGM